MSKEQIDFVVHNCCCIWRFEPISKAAIRESLSGILGRSIEDWQRIGDSFCVEHRMAPDLLKRLREQGWKLRAA